jgi:hypothetical protein
MDNRSAVVRRTMASCTNENLVGPGEIPSLSLGELTIPEFKSATTHMSQALGESEEMVLGTLYELERDEVGNNARISTSFTTLHMATEWHAFSTECVRETNLTHSEISNVNKKVGDIWMARSLPASAIGQVTRPQESLKSLRTSPRALSAPNVRNRPSIWQFATEYTNVLR